MSEMPRPVPGPQPGPDLTAPPVPSGAAPGVVLADRRRNAVPPLSPAEARDSDERTFLELRRKVQASELLAASSEKLLWKMRFNGHLTVVVQNGRVIKSGYEEGYFRRKNDLGGILFET